MRSRQKQEHKILTYDKKNLGRIYPNGEIDPYLTECGLQDLLEEMLIRDKIHMKRQAPDVLKLVQEYAIPERSYLSNEDLAIYCALQGYRNPTELHNKDYHAWELIKDRKGLMDRIFSAVEDTIRDKRKLKGKRKWEHKKYYQYSH